MWISLKSKTCVLWKTTLREWKTPLQTERIYLQITYLMKDLYIANLPICNNNKTLTPNKTLIFLGDRHCPKWFAQPIIFNPHNAVG